MGYIGPGLFFSSFRLNNTIKNIFVDYGVQKDCVGSFLEIINSFLLSVVGHCRSSFPTKTRIILP